MLARSTIHGLALVGALVAAQLQGCRETPEKQDGGSQEAAAMMMLSTYETRPVITGKAAFVDMGGDKTVVKLFLRATDTKPPGSTGSLQSVRFYGATGRKGADELDDVANLLVQLDGPMKPKRDWEVGPRNIPREKLTIPLSSYADPKRLDDYSLLMRFTYRSSSGTEEVDRHGMFSSWAEPARALDMNAADSNEEGDQITNLSGKGAFFGSDGIAMYDFKVDFDGTATLIEAWAAKKEAPGWPASHHKIYSKAFSSGQAASHTVTDAIGRYNGVSDEYWFRVEVTEASGKSYREGTFKDIIANQGVLIPMGG